MSTSDAAPGDARTRAHAVLVCEGASPVCHAAHGRDLHGLCERLRALIARHDAEVRELRAALEREREVAHEMFKRALAASTHGREGA